MESGIGEEGEKAVLVGTVRKKYQLKELLSYLHMAKSSYCYQAKVMRRPDKYSDLRVKIRKIFSNVNGHYGYRRIHAMVRRCGATVSEKMVRQTVKEEGFHLVGINQRKYNGKVRSMERSISTKSCSPDNSACVGF